MDFQNYLKSKTNIQINSEQLKAVKHKNGNGLVLATAGSGKTTVIISRVGKLLFENRDAKILTITFSKMAALEMEKRFTKAFKGISKNNAKFSTIHSFAYRLVLKYFNKKGLEIQLIKDKFNLINEIVKDVYNKERYQNTNKEEIENISNKISYFKNMLYDPKEYKMYGVNIRKFDEIFSKYEKYKKQNNLIDFDDILIYAYKILRTSKVQRDRIKNKYDYIQIDEVQDTSKIQHLIIKLISKDNIFMVGDDDQSIYSFRGSYPEFLLNFKEDFPEGKIYYLSKNYRSDKNIVKAASEFIKRNKVRYDKKISAEKESLEKIEIIKIENKRESIEYIKDKLNKNQTTGILYRYNISALLPANLLLKEGVDFYIKDSVENFFNNNIVKDVTAFFRLSRDGRDKESFRRIYYKCNSYFNKNLVQFVVNGEGSINQRLDMYFDTDKRLESNITRFKENILELSKLDIKEGIEFLLYEMDYLDYLYRLEENGIIRYSNAKVILDILKELGREVKKIEEFERKLKELKIRLEDSNNRDAEVVLSSIHSAKGLEYDNVFLIDNNHGEFPPEDRGEGDFEKSLEEERRIFYVGMTRAKKNLHVLSSGRESLFFNELKYILE
jgi:DNA helicase-2/ATP-dependent DNA helicase PcrA